MNKQSQMKKVQNNSISTLTFGKYNDVFELVKAGESKNLKDAKSEKNATMPIKANGENVYVTEPDGKLIPNISGQKKCDYLLYCPNKPQTCFVELKGANISIKESYNPYDQIIDTIKYLQQDDLLKDLVTTNVEKHAFIVSPGRQKLPRGVETKERQLWQKLVQIGKKKSISNLVHYVKVTKKDRYSNKEQIICSPSSPILMPFND